MIIAVSDVHLGETGFQEQDRQFSNFLDHVQNSLLREGGDLVLLGDIFDFWRGDLVEVLEEYSGIIEKLINFPGNVNIHYIVGNHDFYTLMKNHLNLLGRV
jgi:UDP-2,3-diacylglucosamine pyrophosphatase LpxH